MAYGLPTTTTTTVIMIIILIILLLFGDGKNENYESIWQSYQLLAYSSMHPAPKFHGCLQEEIPRIFIKYYLSIIFIKYRAEEIIYRSRSKIK
jgi:hypothetical protein